MKRRQMVFGSAQLGMASALCWTVTPAILGIARQALSESVASTPRALPSADQIAWQDLEVGMFVHFAPNTWQDAESDELTTPLSAIDPKDLNTDQWAQTAISLGAKYIVFVAKHQGGFCMWQTQTTDYSIRNTPWQGGHGDVLADISASCRKYGLKLGVYVCPRDDNFGAKTGGICKISAACHDLSRTLGDDSVGRQRGRLCSKPVLEWDRSRGGKDGYGYFAE
jgi:alpha-L-fucosidase